MLEHGAVFDKLNVICEGFEYPEDPFVLDGSCGVCSDLVLFLQKSDVF